MTAKPTLTPNHRLNCTCGNCEGLFTSNRIDSQRRRLISSVPAVFAAGIGLHQSARAQTQSEPNSQNYPATESGPNHLRRIDVHSHYLPERYRQEAIAAGHQRPDGMPGLPEWSIDGALTAMDKFGISTSILSVSSPGVHFGDDAAAIKLARAVNEVGAQAVQTHPQRFGLFASLPLPNVNAALKEIAYSLDVLKADGIVMESNHHGIYPGDPQLDPIMEELNRRKAVLFLHPTSPDCPCCQETSLGYPRPMMEFMFETSRAVTNMILKGTLEKYRDIRLIIPHAGAMIPILVDRITGLSPALGLDGPLNTDKVFSLLKGLYYDLAGFPIPRQLGALLQIADERNIMYGSDWPFTPDPVVEMLSKKIDETELLTDEQRVQILGRNALQLFPRLNS